MKHVIHRLWRFSLALVLTLPASATTWIVDANNGPNTNFTDLPAAIAAASPGDIILVRVGQYSPFTLNQGVTIVGTGVGTEIRAPGSSSVTVPAGQIAVLADVRFLSTLDILHSHGTVIADRIDTRSTLTIWDSTDVRLNRHTAKVASFASDARLEIASSTFVGTSATSYGGNGQTCLALGGAFHGLFSRSTFRGGNGGDGYEWSTWDGGDGGAGINFFANTGSTLLIAGGAVSGGAGGWAFSGGLDGWDGDGLFNLACGVWRSGCTFTSGAAPIHYVPGPNSFDIPIAPDDPALELVGTATPGGSVQLDTYATPGSVVRMVIGRLPTLVSTPPIRVDKLVSADMAIFLGVVPPAGKVSYVMPLRLGYVPGTAFYAQAYVADTTAGESRRTNSVPIIVR